MGDPDERSTVMFRPCSGRVELVSQEGEVLRLKIWLQRKDRRWHEMKVKINKKHFKEM